MHTFVPGKFTREELSNFDLVIKHNGAEYGVNMVGDTVDAEGYWAGHFNGSVLVTTAPEPLRLKFLVEAELDEPEGLFRAPKKFVFKTGVKEMPIPLPPLSSFFAH